MTVHRLDGASRRILVIDDDLAIRVLLQAVLRRMNFTVDLAEDGQAGLEKVQSEKAFDLILLDLMMPRINGYEFLERIDAVAGRKRPHIIVFTAAGRRGIDRIPAEQICASILKPFDLDRFIEIIADCLRGHDRHAGAEASPSL
jgi:DNA-binding response OmpR family regulator